MTKIPFRTAYSGPVKSQFNTVGESMTQQHFAEEADIGNIIRKHDRTGLIEHVARGVAQYGDYTQVNEYRESLDIVNSATESFMELPSDIRAKFHNDPGEFFEFATDPKNGEKMVQLGLAEAPPSPQAPAEPAKKNASRPKAAEQAETQSDE